MPTSTEGPSLRITFHDFPASGSALVRPIRVLKWASGPLGFVVVYMTYGYFAGEETFFAVGGPIVAISALCYLGFGFIKVRQPMTGEVSVSPKGMAIESMVSPMSHRPWDRIVAVRIKEGRLRVYTDFGKRNDTEAGSVPMQGLSKDDVAQLEEALDCYCPKWRLPVEDQ